MATRRLAGLVCAMTITLGGAAFAQAPATAPASGLAAERGGRRSGDEG